jgi:hypothetical protein
MGFSTPFIRRPVATILLTFGVAAAGGLAVFQLPVAPLPQVDFPTISVRAQLPGGSPEVVATTVATPLERHLGQIADVTERSRSGRCAQSGAQLDRQHRQQHGFHRLCREHECRNHDTAQRYHPLPARQHWPGGGPKTTPAKPLRPTISGQIGWDVC